MNFRNLEDASFDSTTYIIGPNACGKSNLLDALRFLRDIAKPAGVKPSGGGLQKAVADRGGLKRVRCLNSRKDPVVFLEVEVESDAAQPTWTYRLGFKGEGKVNNRITIDSEEVWQGEQSVLRRPDDADRKDPERLTQTSLEQINANVDFRALAHFLSSITYLHLVPQLLKFSDQIGGNQLERDPFGQGFLLRVADTNEKTRNARLRRIQEALGKVVPQFKELRFNRDKVSGHPHIEANFAHWRVNGSWQREDQFSDGTLRLLGLLWSLMEGESLLLLEEPELSLNEDIVKMLPRLIRRVQRLSKSSRQVLLTTHSEALLSDQSIGAESVIRLMPSAEGTQIAPASTEEKTMLESGFSVGEVLLAAVKPKSVEQLELAIN
jgi:predicted ATPase